MEQATKIFFVADASKALALMEQATTKAADEDLSRNAQVRATEHSEAVSEVSVGAVLASTARSHHVVVHACLGC